MVGKVTPDCMLSASRLPAVMGMSKYRSPNDELQFSIDALNGKVRDDKTSEAMTWGNALEPMIVAEAAKRIGVSGLVDKHPKAYFHPKWPLCCSLDSTAIGDGNEVSSDPDRGVIVVGDDSIKLIGLGVIEAKLTSMAPEDVLPLSRGPIQLQAQMEIVGAEWGAVAVLYQGTTLRVFVFGRHEPTIAQIGETAEDFHRRLTAWEERGEFMHYDCISSKDADRTWPRTKSDPEPVELDIAAEQSALEIVDCKAQIDELQHRIERAEILLKTKLQDAEAGIAGKFEVRWPMRHTRATPEKIVPAKEESWARQSTLKIKERK